MSSSYIADHIKPKLDTLKAKYNKEELVAPHSTRTSFIFFSHDQNFLKLESTEDLSMTEQDAGTITQSKGKTSAKPATTASTQPSETISSTQRETPSSQAEDTPSLQNKGTSSKAEATTSSKQPVTKSATQPEATTRASEAVEIDEKAVENAPPWAPTLNERLIMYTLAVSSLMVALDATILVSVLPTLAVDLKGTTADAFWTGTSYLLTHTVLQPFIAALSDVFGRRELLVPSIVSFAMGSIMCAKASNFTLMLAGRVVQGIGGAGIIALSQVIFADLVPLRQRPKFFTLILGAWALGSIIGPLVGGAFVEKASWRWCFWINLPISGVALPMACYFVRLTVANDTFLNKLRRVDWLGGFLFISSITSTLIAISWGGIQFAWSSWHTLVPLILGVLGVPVSVYYELTFAIHPFLKRSLFSTPSAIASFTCATSQGLVLYMALYYITFMFSSVHLFAPIRAGVSILPATVLLLPGSAIVSALITRTGHFRWAIWGGLGLSTISTALFVAFLNEHATTPVWAVLLCLFGLGMGAVLSSVNISIQAVVDSELAGSASAMYAFMRSMGMTIGVAVGGTVFQNVLQKKLVGLGINSAQAAEIARNSEAFVETMRHGLSEAERKLMVEGYASGFRGVWCVMLGICAIASGVSVLIKKGDVNRLLPEKGRVTVMEENK